MKNTTLAISLVALMGAGLTACNKKPNEEAHTHAEGAEHKHETDVKADDKAHEHAHDEHEHEEHQHAHDEHEHGHDHEEGMEHVGKHVHGEAELTTVVDGNTLTIELNSPAMNVFGFEHKPSTDEQKATVETNETLLKQSAKLFTVNGGDCKIQDTEVTIPFEEHEHEAHHEEHKHEHEEAHDDTHVDEHVDEHEHEEHDVHSDVKSSYTYACADGNAIKSVSVNLFNQFTGFTRIDSAWVNSDKQGSVTLTKEKSDYSFE